VPDFDSPPQQANPFSPWENLENLRFFVAIWAANVYAVLKRTALALGQRGTGFADGEET
jgi:hypothetical protein